MVLDREHLGVEVGGPLPPLLGQRQIAQGVADIGFDLLPEERDVALREIGGRGQAKLLGSPGLDEFVEECGLLPEVVGVGELANQVGRADQATLVCRLLVGLVRRYREAGQLDGRRTRSGSITGPRISARSWTKILLRST